LEGKYKKGGNYLWSLTKEESISPYIKASKDNSYMNKAVEVFDLVTNTTTIYDSIKSFSNSIGRDYCCLVYNIRHQSPFLKRYMIRYSNAV
jgi:hypothetical protein